MPRQPRTLQAPAEMPAIPPGKEVALAEAQDLATQTEENTRQLAKSLGYEGSLAVTALEDEIRFYQRRTVEACLEVGKRLLLLKEATPHGAFAERVEELGFQIKTAQRFMSAAAKTSKSANLSLLSTQVKNTSAFLELVTHDDAELENLKDLDGIDRMSASQLREALRQSEADAKFAVEKREKAEKRADAAEKKLAGNRPVVVPLDERITPFQVEITERQSLLEKALLAHDQAIEALDVWWTEEVTSAPGYDPEAEAPLPPAVLTVAQHLYDSIERTASIVGGLQHRMWSKFGDSIPNARQYLLQDPALAEQASGNG